MVRIAILVFVGVKVKKAGLSEGDRVLSSEFAMEGSAALASESAQMPEHQVGQKGGFMLIAGVQQISIDGSYGAIAHWSPTAPDLAEMKRHIDVAFTSKEYDYSQSAERQLVKATRLEAKLCTSEDYGGSQELPGHDKQEIFNNKKSGSTKQKRLYFCPTDHLALKGSQQNLN